MNVFKNALLLILLIALGMLSLTSFTTTDNPIHPDDFEIIVIGGGGYGVAQPSCSAELGISMKPSATTPDKIFVIAKITTVGTGNTTINVIPIDDVKNFFGPDSYGEVIFTNLSGGLGLFDVAFTMEVHASNGKLEKSVKGFSLHSSTCGGI